MARAGRPSGHRRVRGLLAALATVAATLTGCATAGEPQQPGFTEALRLIDGDELTQTFVARGERLSRLEVLTATYGVEDPDGRLTLVVRGAGQTRTVGTAGDDIEDTAWLTLAFDPIDDAAGETFAATLTWAGSDPIAVFVHEHDPYPSGSLQGRPGDLAFRVGHPPTISATWSTISRIPGEFVRRLAADPVFAVVWLAAVGLAAAALGGSVIRSRRRDAA